jgi:hypothetical protein
MDRWQNSLDRKAFVTRLGTTGLGLGLIVGTAGAPGVSAQEASTPTPAQPESGSEKGEVREPLRSVETRQQLYAKFTAALADELGVGTADKIDAAIRAAMMTVVDAHVDDGLLTAGQGETLKILIATSDVPLGSDPMFEPSPGAFMRGKREQSDEGRSFYGHGGDRERTEGGDDDSRADEEKDRGSESDEEANDNSRANEEEGASS